MCSLPESCFAREVLGRRRTLWRIVPLILLALVPAAACAVDELSADELHAIAWPAARAAYNQKYAAGSEASRSLGVPTGPLAEDAYQRPTSVRREGSGWAVLYGGASAGPAIEVIVDAAGHVQRVTASHAAK